MKIHQLLWLFLLISVALGCDDTANNSSFATPVKRDDTNLKEPSAHSDTAVSKRLYVEAQNGSPSAYLRSVDMSGNLEVNLATVLSRRCQKVTLTHNAQQADYTMTVQYQVHFDKPSNTWHYPGSIVVTSHNGDVIFTTLSASVILESEGLGDASGAVCKNTTH